MDDNTRASETSGEAIENCLRAKDGIFKFISVVPSDGIKYIGWLKTIDPESGSLVLVNFPSEKPPVVDIIMGDSYHKIEVIKDSDPEMREKIEKLFCSTTLSVPKEQLQKSKEKLMTWFMQNRIPAEEDSEILKVGNVTIFPPYGIEQCQGDNPIVLGKIQDLIKSLYNKDLICDAD